MLSLVLVGLVTLVLAVELSQRRRGRYYRLGSGAARSPRIVRLRRHRWTATGFLALLTAVALIIPLGVLLHWLARGLSQGETFSGLAPAVLHSLEAAALAGAVAVAAALPIAIVVVRRPGWLSALIDRASYTGYALPGVVVAFAMIFFSLRVVPGLYQTLAVLTLPLCRAVPTAGDRSAALRARAGPPESRRGLPQPRPKPAPDPAQRYAASESHPASSAASRSYF